MLRRVWPQPATGTPFCVRARRLSVTARDEINVKPRQGRDHRQIGKLGELFNATRLEGGLPRRPTEGPQAGAKLFSRVHAPYQRAIILVIALFRCLSGMSGWGQQRRKPKAKLRAYVRLWIA